MRASVMLHLSGLRLTGDIDGVICGLERLGFAVRGLMGEGTEASGDLFQISNQGTLGGQEGAIIDRLLEIVGEVVRHELNARARVLEGRREYLLDYVGRAFGVLTHARVLSSREAVDFLSAMRLGVELGLVKHLTVMRINETMLMTQPGHLQRLAGSVLESEDRDAVRAGMVRRKLRGVAMTE
jgi:protein arginine kinase